MLGMSQIYVFVDSRRKGYSIRKIAEVTGFARQTVKNILIYIMTPSQL